MVDAIEVRDEHRSRQRVGPCAIARNNPMQRAARGVGATLETHAVPPPAAGALEVL